MSNDRERLQRVVAKSITKVFKDALSFLELAGIDDKQYQRIRRQILRSGNDEIRKISEELEKFDVKYHPSYNERIDFNPDNTEESY